MTKENDARIPKPEHKQPDTIDTCTVEYACAYNKAIDVSEKYHDQEMNELIDTNLMLQGELNHCKREIQRLQGELEQERVRLAGCLCIAEGHFNEHVKIGVYGWSLAYEKTKELRLEVELLQSPILSEDDITEVIKNDGYDFIQLTKAIYKAQMERRKGE